MASITSIASAGTLPTLTSAQPTKLPELRPLPLPLPLPKPVSLDKFLTPGRSEKLAGTQANQLETIQKGVKSGAVTEQEATKLLAEQAKIAAATSTASADGVITAQEAASIRLQQAKAGLDLFLASHNGAHAKPSDRAVTNKQATQIGQIAQGVRSGSLTGEEASNLLTGQSDIAQSAAEAQSDGEVDFIEKQTLNILQDAATFGISQEKHDTEKAPHAGRIHFPVLF